MSNFSPKPPRRRPGKPAQNSSERPAGHEHAPRKQAETEPRAGTGDEQAPLVPGLKPVLELLASSPERVDAVFLRKGRHNADMSRVIDLCRAGSVRFSLLEPPSFARVYSGSSQGVVARLFEAGFIELDDLFASIMDAPLPLLLALDQVQDPGNAGALARTLYALGGAGLIAPRHNGVYLGAAAAKTSAGALDKLPVAKAANLGQAIDSAKKQGITVYGASSGAIAALSGKSAPVIPVLDPFTADLRLPAVLVLGSEENGMRPGMEKRCDFFIRIPMLRDFDSLNVAQAGGIIIGCFARQQMLRG